MFSRLLLQVNSFPDEKENPLKDKPTISIEQSIASTFQLRLYGDVIVNKVDANNVLLDSVEVIFKDQYLSRSDMWRMRNSLKNSVVFLNKKFERHIRFQVFEMWSQGEKVASGYINDQTKIVFRSASSMVYLFVQMSSEMWHFDVNGDLYFEKAVNGFLSDLFEKWKRFNCNHDVTIVLFSRTYYEASSSEEFPKEMRDCLQRDHRGKFYEDFYRVAIQNERYDEWSSTIVLLKKLFNSYETEVLRIHEKYDKPIPKAYNSTASQGNFLEVLNMSLNVFEKHYLDRSFDRTGQLSVVISPGVGVFEVDHELTTITKQRIIDNGIGSDLVCLGEQPLHAVPLFKFNRRQVGDHRSNSVCSDYNMPHWINLSFYTSQRQSRFSTFIPRIKMPNILAKKEQDTKCPPAANEKAEEKPPTVPVDSSRSWFLNDSLAQIEKRNAPPSEADLEAEYDRYDREVFCSGQPPEQPAPDKSLSTTLRVRKKSVLSSPFSVISANASRDDSVNQLSKSASNRLVRKMADEVDGPKSKMLKHDEPAAASPAKDENNPLKQPLKSINPFNPKNIPFKLTSNRRRWTHVFPLGPSGVFMQQHHYRTFPQNTACTLLPINSSNDLRQASSTFHLNNNSINVDSLSLLNVANLSQTTTGGDEPDGIHTPDQSTLYNYSLKDKRISFSDRFRSKNFSNVTLTYGNPDEHFVFSTGITTGVDWKSLIIPACLPLTTDYLPDPKSLENDYLDSEYTLEPEYQSADLFERRCYKDEDHHNHNPLKTEQVFLEFVSQRLQQGFQVIMNPASQLQLQSSTPLQANTPNLSKALDNPLDSKTKKSVEPVNQTERLYVMSIGRIFHRLELDNNSTVKVKTYRPRQSLSGSNPMHYCYRFRAPEHELYGVSWVDFITEQLENYNWSYLDNYICLRGGESEYELRESLKFWRLRMLLLPSMQQQTRQILDNISNISVNKDAFHCDIYSRISSAERARLTKGFLRFFSIINRIKNQPTKGAKETVKQSTINNPDLNSRRFSSGFTGLSSLRQHSEGSFRDRFPSVAQLDTKPLTRRALLFNEKTGKSSAADDDLLPLQASSIAENELRSSVENISYLDTTAKKLNAQNLSAIIDEMRKGFNGFQFLPKQGNLPGYLFTSADAVQWSMQSIDGIQNEQQALELFQKLLDHRLICHASGQAKYPFKYGFFLYYIVVKASKETKQGDDRVDLEMYKREWFEVEISSGAAQNQQPTSSQPPAPAEQRYSRLKNPINSIKFLNSSSQSRPQVDLDANNKQTTMGTNYYKSVLDTDFGSKTKRAEWLHIKYQQVYNPVQAFEIVLEWMVSTSNQIAEIVQGWARKVGSTGLHLVPIPSDPFAMPFYRKSDPLRAPIYVQINFDCLPAALSEQLLGDEAKLCRFREEILCRFGFLPFLGGIKKDQKQFVHVSGSIFVLIPNREKDAKDESGDHEIYLTRHFSGSKQSRSGLESILVSGHWTLKFEDRRTFFGASSDSRPTNTRIPLSQTGFHWSWNYMISKRWKSSTTGDETFQRRVLKDFKQFCANDQGRLAKFADEIQSIVLDGK